MKKEAAQSDERFMQRALQLARRGIGRVEPNPMVGCVLVRGGRIIGEGWHRRFGGPHAEINALRACRASPRGATAFVTLEPCCHFGKTPPCVDALLAAGIVRVVAGAPDPNPQIAGRGLAKLRQAGVQVDVGLLRPAADALIAPFRKLIREHRPWVIGKWAQSLDGKLATHRGDSRWITADPARRHAHQTRGRVDAILVGVGTVLADDPLLTCRGARPQRRATRIILDSELRTPLTARVVTEARPIPTLFFCDRAAPAARVRRLEARGGEVRFVKSAPAGRARRSRSGQAGVSRLDLEEILTELGRRQMTNVLVEGGGTVLGDFLDRGLIDEAHIYVAPLLIGGRDAPGPWQATGAHLIRDALEPHSVQARRLGRDWLWTLRFT